MRCGDLHLVVYAACMRVESPAEHVGKQSRLFTWLGVSERPDAYITSLRAERASSRVISGSGLARAEDHGGWVPSAYHLGRQCAWLRNAEEYVGIDHGVGQRCGRREVGELAFLGREVLTLGRDDATRLSQKDDVLAL